MNVPHAPSPGERTVSAFYGAMGGRARMNRANAFARQYGLNDRRRSTWQEKVRRDVAFDKRRAHRVR